MVFETFLLSEDGKIRHWRFFIFGFIYTTLGMFLAAQIFKAWASLVMVFLAMLASVPVFYTLTIQEEKRILSNENELTLWKRHNDIIMLFIILFLGMVCAFAFWYFILPKTVSTSLFSLQTSTIGDINSKITGQASIPTGKLSMLIFINNLKVLVSALIFSFLYGIGALFILTWNASVLGTAMGSFAKSQFTIAGSVTGLTIGGTIYAGIITLLRFWIHGIPEMAGYFVGGLAGGILSVAIMHHDISTKYFEKITLDVAVLLFWAIGILLVSAGIEVFITPLIVKMFSLAIL